MAVSGTGVRSTERGLPTTGSTGGRRSSRINSAIATPTSDSAPLGGPWRGSGSTRSLRQRRLGSRRSFAVSSGESQRRRRPNFAAYSCATLNHLDATFARVRKHLPATSLPDPVHHEDAAKVSAPEQACAGCERFGANETRAVLER